MGRFGVRVERVMTDNVALDVHQASTVASVRDQSARVIARIILPTEGAAIVEVPWGTRRTIHIGALAPLTLLLALRT